MSLKFLLISFLLFSFTLFIYSFYNAKDNYVFKENLLDLYLKTKYNCIKIHNNSYKCDNNLFILKSNENSLLFKYKTGLCPSLYKVDLVGIEEYHKELLVDPTKHSFLPLVFEEEIINHLYNEKKEEFNKICKSKCCLKELKNYSVSSCLNENCWKIKLNFINNILIFKVYKNGNVVKER